MAKITNLDFYAILGVHPNAEDIVIRAAFKALAQRYHPDRFAGSKEDAHRRMADLTNAYETLSDPARRRKYDRRRGLQGRTARFYFKNPARDRPTHFGALAARAAAKKQRRYRAAVYVLMVAVVILSAFNIHQHAPQLREFFALGRAVPGAAAADASSRGEAVPSSPAAPDALPAGAPAQATTANVRILPITQGATRPIGANPIEAPVPAPHTAEPAGTSAPQPPANAGTLPSRPAVIADPGKASRAAAIAPAPAEATPKETRRAAAVKPAVAKSTEPARPNASPPAAAASETCEDTVAALGLCTRK